MNTPRKLDRVDRRAAKGLRGRDPQALQAIYDRYGGTTFGYLLKALGDRGIAEDVQQQVFLEVWTRGESYDPARAGLLTWIMQIARSRAIDQLRRRVPTPADPETVERTVEADGGATPLGDLDDQWRVSALLRRLPADEASMLKMRFYEGMSQSEIATSTGIPLGTVKMRMVQALERLRGLIEEEGL